MTTSGRSDGLDLPDPRVIPDLLHALTDEREPLEVRLHALKRVRDASLSTTAASAYL
jgi:hypothetical protein